MTGGTIVTIGIFLGMQVISQLIFKWGSTYQARWWLAFIAGNLLGCASIWLLMLAYKAMHPNIALGICGGGSFLMGQLALAFVFRAGVSPLQWGGVAAITAGMIMLAAGKG